MGISEETFQQQRLTNFPWNEFFFVNREIMDLFSAKRNQHSPFTTLISGCDKLSHIRAFGWANSHAWQYTVFAADFDARDREENFYRVWLFCPREARIAPCCEYKLSCEYVVSYKLSCEYIVANKRTYLSHVVHDICHHFEI
jgi:hypothetical protein